jgi:hypothetical protein
MASGRAERGCWRRRGDTERETRDDAHTLTTVWGFGSANCAALTFEETDLCGVDSG